MRSTVRSNPEFVVGKLRLDKTSKLGGVYVMGKGNKEIAAGGVLGGIAACELAVLGTACPLCVVGAAALLTLGGVKKFRARKK